MAAKALNEAYANVEILDANPFNPSLAAKPRHASFDNMLGSINYQLNKNGSNEGILSAESMIFWLDTADSKAKTPSFYISKGIFFALFRGRFCSGIYGREILFGRFRQV